MEMREIGSLVRKGTVFWAVTARHIGGICATAKKEEEGKMAGVFSVKTVKEISLVSQVDTDCQSHQTQATWLATRSPGNSS